jgi:hypothetical protein
MASHAERLASTRRPLGFLRKLFAAT